MKRYEKGLGGLQVLLAMAAMGIVSLVAVPHYESFSNRAKITEVLEYANGSVQKASHYFIDSGQFPSTTDDADALMTDLRSAPDFVTRMVVTPDESGDSVLIRVFVQEGVFDNKFGVEQYVFLEGVRSPHSSFSIHWRCGTRGIDLMSLPGSCHG